MISIVMPVKNAESYLSDCLESIINQSYTDWELIAVNDHSEDTSASILKEYSQRDSRITVIQNSGKGIIHALRTAYRLSVGDYITRMDADDLMTPDKLELMLTLLKKSGPNHVVTGCVEYFSAREVGEGYQKYAAWLNRLSKAENNFSEIYKECVIASPCWLISREDFNKCDSFDSDLYPEDYDLCFRFRNAGLHIKTVDKVLHKWRDHASRASRNDPHYLDNRFLELKMHHFINEDYNSNKSLVLWGAGKKAKIISLTLKDKNIPYRWICNNPKKIGKIIYDKILESVHTMDEIQNAQVIIAVANPIEQSDIKKTLQLHGENQAFFFC